MKFTRFAALLLALLLLLPLALAEGDKAPEGNPFLTAEAVDIQGEAYDLQQLEGKPLFVHFWSSQCHYCVEELPILSELSLKYKDRMVLLGIALDARMPDDKGELQDDQDEIAAVRALYKEKELAFTTLIPNDLHKAIEFQFAISVLPTTMLIDDEGKFVVDPIEGSRSKEAWEEIIDAFLSVMEAPAS